MQRIKSAKAILLIGLFLIFVFVFQSCGSINWPVPGVSEQSVSTCPSDWYGNCRWSYRQKITIDESMIPDTGAQDLSNFPVLIKITDQSNPVFTNAASANGYDILFTSSDGITKLDHEIEYYKNTPTKELDVWVRIPTLDYNDDTEIYMYYGNPSITTDPSTSNTWDGNYAGIWHLKEERAGTGTSGVYQDSTSNNNDGNDWVSATGQNGQIDGGQEFDGVDDYVDAGNNASLNITNVITISAWVYGSTLGDWDSVLMKTTGDSWNDGYGLFYRTNGNIYFWVTQWNANFASYAPFSTGVWHHVVGIYDGSNVRIFIDGVEGTSDPYSGSIASTNASLYIGRGGGLGYYWGGIIDEVRVSDTARSADWITTSYNNQNTLANYLTFGAQESF